MTFLNPALLFGLLAVGIPVVIHLLTRPKLKRVPWAAMRLLQLCLQKTKRRSKLEDLLLLLLRCLLVALLVLLFARPALLVPSSEVTSDQAVAAVVLLDDSASMGQSDGIRTRFDEAKAKIDDLLAGLPNGSTCALYLVSDRARGLIPSPTRDLGAVRRAVDAATVTDRGSNLLPGLMTAVDLLKPVTGRKREIYVATDSQVPAWRDSDKVKALCETNQRDIGFHFFVPDKKGEDNLAVSGLKLIDPVAAVGQPVRCAVEVSNWSDAAAENILVQLAADDGPSQDQEMIKSIEPGTSGTVELAVRFPEAGYHSVTATIPGDRLPPDNRRSVALRVIGQLRTLIVEGTNAEGTPRDGFFLEHALTPVPPEQLAQYYLKTTRGPVAELDGPLTDSYEMVFLSNIARLSAAESKNLRDYVDQGGALVVFPGPTTDTEFYDSDPDFSALLPAALQPAIDAPDSRKFLTWQSSNYQHPVTTLWNDPQSGTLASAHFFKFFPMTLPTGSTDAATQVVVNYSDGEPAVAERTFGKGRVFLFSSTATTTWNDLPIHNAFVPLLLRLVGYTIGGENSPLNIVAGQPFSFTLGVEEAAKDFYLERPGHPGERVLAGKLEPEEHAALVHYAGTDMAGVYRLFTGDSATPRVVFAAQMDPTESNLQQPPATELGTLLQGNEPDAQAIAAAKPQAPPRMVPGKEFWFLLAVIALLLALFETAVAHRFSRVH